ncbi:MAG: 2-dehydropantoate 2-reductase [Myxococcota bacterium]
MHVGVFGAGAIGCFMGIRLSAAGTKVTLLGRARLVEAAERLSAVPQQGPAVTPAADMVVSDDPAALSSVDVCLLTVKSGATADAAKTLADVLPPHCVVVSMQNGLENPPLLRSALTQPIAAGMVSYNVFRDESPQAERYVQATSGPLMAERQRGPAAQVMEGLREAFGRAGEELSLHDDLESVAAGKLLLNLNNGICAATGLTIAESLRSRDARWCFGACMREGVAVLKQTGPKPANVIGIPPFIIARMLSLPNFIVTRVAKGMVNVDPSARSSTLQDVLAGRRTEIGALNGAIVALAKQAGRPAPANATVTKLVEGLHGRTPPPFVTPRGLRAEIERAIDTAR